MVYKVDIDKAKRTKQRLQEESQKVLLPLWIPPEKRNKIRILPPWSEDGIIGHETRWHWNVGPDHKAIPCPRTIDRECSLCDFVRELRQQKNPKAQDWYAKKRIYYNLIVRDEQEKGVQLYASGVRVYENLLTYLYDEEWGDITDIEKGRDMILERTGQGKEDTQYTLMPNSSPSPLHPDQEIVDKWLESMYNLDTIINYPDDADIDKLVGVAKKISGSQQPTKQLSSAPDTTEADKAEHNKSKKDLANKIDTEIASLEQAGGSKL